MVKISGLTEVSQVASGDYFPMLDVSDTAQGSSGSTRRATFSSISPATIILNATGTADDVVIQAAIDTVYGLGGGRIVMKRGDYAIASTIKVRDNIIISGEGSDTLLTLNNSVNDDVFQSYDTTNGHDNVTIESLKINGNKSNQSSGSGINLADCRNVRIRDTIISSCKTHGINFDGSLTEMIWIKNNVTESNDSAGICLTDNVLRVLIEGNRSYSNGTANININGYGTYIHIVNNFCRNSGTGDNITGYNTLNDHISVLGNHCLDGNNHNIHIAGDHLIVADNQLEDSTNEGIRIETDDALTNCSYVTIKNNLIKSSRNGIYLIKTNKAVCEGNIIESPTAEGIICDTVSDSSISNNVIVGTGSNTDGIRLHKSGRNQVIGNLCKNNGRYGIYLTDDGATTSTLNVINGNNCYDDQGSKTQDYGIFSANSADYNIYTNNIIRAADHTTGSSSLAGSNNTTANNIT